MRTVDKLLTGQTKLHSFEIKTIQEAEITKTVEICQWSQTVKASNRIREVRGGSDEDHLGCREE